MTHSHFPDPIQIVQSYPRFQSDSLILDYKTVGQYSLPEVSANRVVPNSMPRPFNYLPIRNPQLVAGWYHFFIADKLYERLWNNFDKYIPYLEQMDGMIATDFSIYRDMSLEEQVVNCYRNRIMAIAMQKVNANVIPTASFGGEETWDWCFDGLPKHSTVAVTTNGTLSDPEACRLFIGGIDEIVKRLSPSAIVVCGSFPEWLTTKYANVMIVPIHSYSQIWRMRRCG